LVRSEVARRWDLESGSELGVTVAAGTGPALAPLGEADGRGAELFKKCSVCHSVEPNGRNRAGPTLYGVFGRRAGALEDYKYSDALEHMDVVWTAETIARLFELGPDVFTPGTKITIQRIPYAVDRAALPRY